MPANGRPPSFQFYPRDFISDPAVQSMTLEQVGAYFRLLCFAWMRDRAGWLPDDDGLLAGLSGMREEWAVSRATIARAFDLSHEGWWVQKRMVETRKEQKRFSKRQSAAAHARWDKYVRNKDGSGMPPAMQRVCSASASASASALEESKTPTTPPAQSLRADKPRSGRQPANGSVGLPTNTNGEWHPTTEELEAWASAYPAMDIGGTMLEMRAWLVANPTRRKTLNGMARFVNTWLAKEQNRL
jgi:uncharacterized protein YdaU (DUF1376 family)